MPSAHVPTKAALPLRSLSALLLCLPALALAYSEKAEILTRNADPSYQGGPIAAPDVQHFATTPHLSPFTLSDSAVIPSSYTPGVNYVRESAVAFDNKLPFITSHSRYEGHNLDANAATYATGAMSYSFTLSGAPNALVPISITSLFELSTNRPTAFINGAFAEVGLALTVNDPQGVFSSLYGAGSSFISMRCQTVASGADCINRAGDDALAKSVDGVVLPSTVQLFAFDAVGQRNLRSGQMAYAFGLPLDASGSAFVTLTLSATTFAANGLFDDDFTCACEQSSLHVADAYIDPIVLIDAGYLASHPGTLLTIEAGLGNGPTAAVPELPSGALLLAGLACLAAGVRRWRAGGPGRFDLTTGAATAWPANLPGKA
jgi:hypothetical protein